MNEHLARQISDGTRRVEKFEDGKRTLWIKRPETLKGLMRLLKGDPKTAFQAEIAAHQDLLAKGVPVPPIVAVGSDYIVTEDIGRTIRHQMNMAKTDKALLDRMLTDAARALARMHASGASHGRPNLKDIVWSAGEVGFLDFERTGREADHARAEEMDVLMFVFSTCAETHGSKDAMAVARDAYAAEAPETWQRAVRRHRRFRPLRFLLWPIVKLRPDKRDFAAIKPFFEFMGSGA